MTTTKSAQDSWELALRVDLTEIMDDLDPGWGTWTAGADELSPAR